jgi:hypothetical protein
MPEPIPFPKLRKLKDATWGERYQLNLAIDRRNELMWKVPIISERITRIDMWLLLQQPLRVPIKTVLDIHWRACYCAALFYEDTKHPAVRHRMLVALRKHYAEWMQLPEKWRERTGDPFAVWRDVLEEEENEFRECAADA